MAEQQSFTARALNQQELDIEDLARGVYAEDAMGGPQAWAAVAHTMNNRRKSGKYGETWNEVLSKSLSSVRKNSKQYKLTANDGKDMNQYERNVFDKIKRTVAGVINGQIPDNTGGATHFENLEKYGVPYWAKEMDAVGRVGEHTYFREKPQPPPTIRGGGG